MNRFQRSFLVVALPTVAWLCLSVGAAGELGRSPKVTFFAGAASTHDADLAPYASVPADTARLVDSKIYPWAVKGFLLWMHKMLRPEYLPSDAFVLQNIRLFKASKTAGRTGQTADAMDMMFLCYSVNGINVMIVQTSSLFCVFLDHHQPLAPVSAERAQAIVQGVAKEWMTEEQAKKIPRQFTATQLDDTVKFGYGISRMYLSKEETALLLPKANFIEGLPTPWEPQEKEWFDYSNNSAPRK